MGVGIGNTGAGIANMGAGIGNTGVEMVILRLG